MMKELERYLGVTHSNSGQTFIVNKTLATFSDSDIPTIIPEMGVKCPKTDS